MATSNVVTLAQFKRKQAEIGNRAAKQALSLLRPLRGEIVTKAKLVEIVRQVMPAVKSERKAAAELGELFYMSQRAQHVDEVSKLSAPFEPYVASNLVSGMYEFVRPGEEFNAPVEASRVVARHVKSASRRRVVGLSLVDGAAEGWARTSGGTTACAFCLMLISRGPVYKTRESAGDMKRFHNHCDCVIVPVFNKKNFPGYDEWKTASGVWVSSTRGKTGNAALKAFRDHLSSAPGGQAAA